MCVVALALNADPRWRIIIAANRDEFHDRPAAPLDRWADNAHLIAGRDLRSGGTWLGVSEQGRLAVITNVRGLAPDPSLESRGTLVSHVLAGTGRYADLDVGDLDRFNGFNLIVVDSAGARVMTNRPTPAILAVESGIHAVSNGELGEDWPRAARIERRMADWLSSRADHPADLFDLLADEEASHDCAVDPSPIFIRNPVYGTRCSTVITIDALGQGTITERRFAADGCVTGETRFTFGWHIGF
jgi:uncharacterized protein with NRDE domain